MTYDTWMTSLIFITFLPWSSPHQIRMKEEKEILEHFAGVVSIFLIEADKLMLIRLHMYE